MIQNVGTVGKLRSISEERGEPAQRAAAQHRAVRFAAVKFGVDKDRFRHQISSSFDSEFSNNVSTSFLV